jgi:hypothetical protein
MILFYAKKRAEKTTLKSDSPEIASVVPSLVLDPAVGVGTAPVELPVLLTVDNPDELERTTPVAVGRPA